MAESLRRFPYPGFPRLPPVIFDEPIRPKPRPFY